MSETVEKLLDFVNPANQRVQNLRVCTFFRDDLHPRFKDIPFSEITRYCFTLKDDIDFKTSHIVMFVDVDGETKIFKQRYGSPGVVVPEKTRK